MDGGGGLVWLLNLFSSNPSLGRLVIGIGHKNGGRGGSGENRKTKKTSHYKSVLYCLQLQAALRINFH